MLLGRNSDEEYNMNIHDIGIKHLLGEEINKEHKFANYVKILQKTQILKLVLYEE